MYISHKSETKLISVKAELWTMLFKVVRSWFYKTVLWHLCPNSWDLRIREFSPSLVIKVCVEMNGTCFNSLRQSTFDFDTLEPLGYKFSPVFTLHESFIIIFEEFISKTSCHADKLLSEYTTCEAIEHATTALRRDFGRILKSHYKFRCMYQFYISERWDSDQTP